MILCLKRLNVPPCAPRRLVPPQDAGEEWKVIGDPPKGVADGRCQSGLNRRRTGEKISPFALLPFDSGRMRIIHSENRDSYMPISRAPTAVIERCTMFWKTPGKAWSERSVSPLSRIAMASQFTGLALARKTLTPELPSVSNHEIEKALFWLQV